MDKSNLMEVNPLKSVRSVTIENDDTTNLSSSQAPLMVTPLQTIRPSDDFVNEETHNTTTTHTSLIVTPHGAIIPFDDSNKNNSHDAVDYGPSTTGPIRRGRGRPKGSKNKNKKKAKIDETANTSSPAPLMVTPLEIVGPFTLPGEVNKEIHNTTTPLPLLMLEWYPSGSSTSTSSIRRRPGRPNGSKNKNSTTTKKKQKPKPETIDPVLKSKWVTSCPNFDSGISEAERETGNRELTSMVLMRFDAVRRRLCQLGYTERSLSIASSNCRNLGVRTNMRKRIGPVPGIEVGDIFYYWGEMCLVGLHMQNFGGIDYLSTKDGGRDGPLAISIVTSGHYDDQTKDLETLVYTGQGGGIDKRSGQLFDQKLVKGNLAMVTSKEKGNEIRVIRGVQDPNDKKKKIYIYDGLYFVTDFWKARGRLGSGEFKFRLVRKPDQPSGYAIWKLAENLRNNNLIHPRKGHVLHRDISMGVEALPISIVNDIDDDEDKKLPKAFSYMTSLNGLSLQPLSVTFTTPRRTGCINCRDTLCQSPFCACIQRNGPKSPYLNRILVCRKPMVYECGYACPCTLDCKHNVVRTGLKIRLEVFKTKSCGWGLRSWEPIRAGTFICEFAGTDVTNQEIEDDDEWVFDTSRVCSRFKWNYEPELIGEDCWEQASEVFSIPWRILVSAKEYGNAARFMNHNCSPNVMWQPIECERNGEPCLRIAFFAMKHIPPLTELTYDYGASSVVEEVGEDENLLKGKNICLCGSIKCRGSFG